MANLSPISLCNAGYKIISKVLCQRLKKYLPRIILETQSTFVSGRLISDNILIAQEMFHCLRINKSCKKGFMAVKMDMNKAYDRVEWLSIENIRKFGFAEASILWIMCCIKSVEYKVLLNGKPKKGKIFPERGLRRGNLLFPYLFFARKH